MLDLGEAAPPCCRKVRYGYSAVCVAGCVVVLPATTRVPLVAVGLCEASAVVVGVVFCDILDQLHSAMAGAAEKAMRAATPVSPARMRILLSLAGGVSGRHASVPSGGLCRADVDCRKGDATESLVRNRQRDQFRRVETD